MPVSCSWGLFGGGPPAAGRVDARGFPLKPPLHRHPSCCRPHGHLQYTPGMALRPGCCESNRATTYQGSRDTALGVCSAVFSLSIVQRDTLMLASAAPRTVALGISRAFTECRSNQPGCLDVFYFNVALFVALLLHTFGKLSDQLEHANARSSEFSSKMCMTFL